MRSPEPGERLAAIRRDLAHDGYYCRSDAEYLLNEIDSLKYQLGKAALAGAGRSSLHDGWQPIETAPERRKVIVTWVNALGKRRTTFASFWPIGTLDMGDGTPEDNVDEDGKNVSAGWYEESEANEEDFWCLTEMLTHWQLPPAPPASLPLRAGEPQ